ncbi:cytidine deaminase [Rhodococcus marinonascens]|uniref:cytidine deaminase n=1 Tax=Rhodococcus marinonascens TaxID=38311 RepID=UPI000932DA6B|nr:cytidine deaminase [Rhodococcus marinonascens]
MTELSAEDAKLVVLARGAFGRTGSGQGAAIRDLDGRTYSAGAVALKLLSLTALQATISAAVSSGAEGFEAAVVIGASTDDPGIAALHEVSAQAVVVFAQADGSVIEE